MNYMEGGFQLFHACLRPEYSEYRNYFLGEFPDVCICGNKLSSSGNILRDHCRSCKGNNWSAGYEIQRVSIELEIHYSWLEMAFCVAVWLNGDSNNG